MTKTLAAWKWSLSVVARSYRVVVLLAALIALWALGAYAWLGLPAESAATLLLLSLLWAVSQILIAVVIVGGIAASAVELAASGSGNLRLSSLWRFGWKRLGSTLLFCAVSFAAVWACSAVFDWINAHSLEVASFLTFHSQKPVSHVLIEKVYAVVEGLAWTVIGGFLVSFFMVYLRWGWGKAAAQTGKLLAASAWRSPFLTTLLSAVVFGEFAWALATWHPLAPAGFWDYAQLVARFSVVLLVISVGALFWLLSLAHLQFLEEETPPA